MGLKVCELFAGVGGLTLGALRAGMDVRLAVELDRRALSAHMTNFPNVPHLQRDVAQLSGRDLLSHANLAENELDGLIGGPPCQGFSIIGKREASDERNNLLGHFARLVLETRPRFFLMENVTGLLHERNAAVLRKFVRKLSVKYQVIGPVTISASTVGAPTSRTRVFYLGILDSSRIPALSVTQILEDITAGTVNVRHALQGLPLAVDEDWRSNPWGKARVHQVQDSPFRKKILDDRPNGAGSAAVLGFLERGIVLNHQGTVHSAELRKRYDALAPGEQDLITKSVRLRATGLCPTLRAGTDKDRGSFQAVRPIHHREARVISPREAARLQSFPDWFVFDQTKWQAFRQIGNSVPPLLAEAVLSRVIELVERA